MISLENNVVYIVWEGPYSLNEIKEINTRSDYGLYQIYGSHPVYGSGVLIYIGKAETYSFGKSILLAGWEYFDNVNELHFYIGRLQGETALSEAERSQIINGCYKLLIYAHSPAYNSEYINNFHTDEDVRPLQVINCSNYKDLLPEVSGMKWASGLARTVKNYKFKKLFLEDAPDFVVDFQR